MGSIEFDESRLGNLQEIGQKLFDEQPENDPRSVYYKREFVRPEIPWRRVTLWLAALVLIPLACVWVTSALSWAAVWCVLTAVGATLLYLVLSAKAVCLTAVRLYQRFAPESIRRKCRFEPSCSQYMIAAIEKYGVCKGVCKGIGRLKRCNIHDGGFDEP